MYIVLKYIDKRSTRYWENGRTPIVGFNHSGGVNVYRSHIVFLYNPIRGFTFRNKNLILRQ